MPWNWFTVGGLNSRRWLVSIHLPDTACSLPCTTFCFGSSSSRFLDHGGGSCRRAAQSSPVCKSCVRASLRLVHPDQARYVRRATPLDSAPRAVLCCPASTCCMLRCLHVRRAVPCRFFKRFNVPELDALKLPLEEAPLSWHHANNTLVVSYAKPPAVIAAVSCGGGGAGGRYVGGGRRWGAASMHIANHRARFMSRGESRQTCHYARTRAAPVRHAHTRTHAGKWFAPPSLALSPEFLTKFLTAAHSALTANAGAN